MLPGPTGVLTTLSSGLQGWFPTPLQHPHHSTAVYNAPETRVEGLCPCFPTVPATVMCEPKIRPRLLTIWSQVPGLGKIHRSALTRIKYIMDKGFHDRYPPKCLQPQQCILVVVQERLKAKPALAAFTHHTLLRVWHRKTTLDC